MNKDISFSSKSSTFKNNIYGTSKGKIREAVLLRDLETFLINKPQLRVLDIGGGQGQIALQLAELGHRVTISDISNEMLEIGQREAETRGIENVTFIHSSLQELSTKTNEKFDLVLCHAVFEWLDDPKEALSTLTDFCLDDGHISLMFYNKACQVFSNLVYGNFEYLDNGLKAKKTVKLNPQKGLTLDEIETWSTELGLKEQTRTGVRVFHDYMRDIRFWDSKFDQILEYELRYSKELPYLQLARYIHLIMQK